MKNEPKNYARDYDMQGFLERLFKDHLLSDGREALVVKKGLMESWMKKLS